MKGQISFDFIVALIFALILIHSINVFSQNFLQNQERVNVRLQEQQIIAEIKTVLLYAKLFEHGNFSYELDHFIPKIYLSSKPGPVNDVPIGCEINITATDITITVNSADKNHFERIAPESISQTTDNPAGIGTGIYNCGDTFTVTG